MDTVLYIVLGIAVMAYQAYSENKKKEARRNAAKPLVKNENTALDEIEKDLESFMTTGKDHYAEIVSPSNDYKKDTDKDTDVEKAKGYKEGEAPVAYESIDMHKYDIEEKQTSFDESNEPDYEHNNEVAYEDNEEGLVVDPRLFVIYSELAKPKFNE